MTQHRTPVKINTAVTDLNIAELLIAPATVGRRPLIIQGLAGQTGPLVEIQSSTGGYLSQFTNDGNLRIGAPLSGVQPATSFVICAPYQGMSNWPNLAIVSNDTQAADKGGSLSLGGTYTDAGAASPFARIAAGKDNSITGDTGAYLSLATRPTGAGMTERLRIPSSGGLELRNGSTVVLGISAAGAFTTAVTLAEGANIVTGTVTGTKVATNALQKLGFWNAVPVIQNTGWTVTAGYTADKSFSPASTTLTETATVLGTLIDALKSYGLLG